MIIQAHAADYIVDLGADSHLACARHTQGMIHMARIAQVPISIIELDTGHMFYCEVCDLQESQGVRCH